MLIHGKVYIIDDHIAYLGSLNFVGSGAKYNYETRVRIADVDAVQKTDNDFEELYHNETLAFVGIEEWEFFIFPEPEN